MSDYKTCADKDLSEFIQHDDHNAFTEIYSRYWKKMLLIAWNHTKDKSLSKDIVHEVFLRLWERRQLNNIENLSAFLATAVKFSVFKYYQKEQRRTQLAKQNYLFEETFQGEEKLDALFLKEYINGIIEEMPEKCKLVFKCSRELGMKNSEIAEMIQITEKGVEANLTRALKIIRGELKNYGLTAILAIQAYLSFFK
jgi:RNA polymerase sigma-70 factor (family 1)